MSSDLIDSSPDSVVTAPIAADPLPVRLPRGERESGGIWPFIIVTGIAAVVEIFSWQAAAAQQPGATVTMLMYAAGRLRLGKMPLWNPYVGLGQPLLGNGHVTIFYPAVALFMFLRASLAWRICAFLHLLLAGCGTLLLARHAKLPRPACLMAAIIFMLGGLTTTAVNSPAAMTMAWLPWGVLAIDRLMQKRTLSAAMMAALVIALALLAGDASASLALLIFLLLVCALCAISRPLGAIRSIGPLLLAIVLGIGVAGVQCLPVHSVAMQTLSPARGVEITGSAISPWIGLTAVFLAIAGVIIPPHKIPGFHRIRRWQFLAAISALIAFLSPLLADHLHSIGIIDLRPSAFWSAAILPTALLSALGLTRLTGHKGVTLIYVRSNQPSNAADINQCDPFMSALLICASGAVAAAVWAGMTMQFAERRWVVMGVILPLALLGIIALLSKRGRLLTATGGSWIWLVLVTAELAAVSLPIARASSAAAPAAIPPDVAAMIHQNRLAHPGQPFRISAPMTLLPAANVQAEAQSLGVADLTALITLPSQRQQPLMTQDHRGISEFWLKLLGVKFRLRMQNNSVICDEDASAFPRAWTVRDAQWMPSAEEATQRLAESLESTEKQPHIDGKQVVLLDRQLPQWAADWVDSAEKMGGREAPALRMQGNASPLPPDCFVSAGGPPPADPSHANQSLADPPLADGEPEQVRIRLGHASGWVVIANAYDPGWVAHIDTKVPGVTPIPQLVLPAYGFLQAVPIRDAMGAKSELVLDYQPIAFRWGVYLTCGSGLLWIILLACGFMQGRRYEKQCYRKQSGFIAE